ncbi:MAG: hypothetical protein DMF75_15935 [Acidobacteria bacterium]|nr:MAG: hypothetical protein DMF75_15935 [Acidobacteriota bacterium]
MSSMDPEHWQQIKLLLHSALERAPVEWPAFLDEACAGNSALRSQLEALLASHERTNDFIEMPAFEVMADMLTDEQQASLVGLTIGRYQILELLGAGGMGEVYLAQDKHLLRKVALKTLPGYLTRDEELVRRFQREARSVSALNHPNILTIHEIGEVDSCHFMVTEFIEGETLRQRLTRGPLKIEPALDIGSQVASALCAAHQVGITHRDIKPENIMLREDGIVKVLDFGLAKLTERKGDDSEATTLFHTKQGTVLGTAHYMSPEQARGLPLDARTDIFSFGVVLYEMVTGETPFAGETTTDVLASILTVEPPPLSSFQPQVPPELDQITSKALGKAREERYQDIRELLSHLQKLKQRLEFEATNPIMPGRNTSSAEYVVATIRRHRTSVAAAIAIFLLITTLGIAYSFFNTKARAIDSLAVLPFVNSTADPNSEYLSDGITESIIYSTSKLPRLRVIPSSSVFRFKGKGIDPQIAGHELGVTAVMTGRVNQHGDDLLISAELIAVRDNSLLWGQQYTRKLADLLTVQEEIAREISERLRTRLTIEEQKQFSKRYTGDVQAYQLYLKGRYYWNKRTRDGYKKATQQFEQAIEKDPSYALAYAGIADCYNVLSSYGIASPRESIPKGEAAARRALEIDGDLAEAHTSLAYVKYQYEWDWAGGESEFRRALELNPNYSTAHQWYALELAGMGRMTDALREINRAQELDPLSLIANVNAGWIFYHARQYDRALEQIRKSLDMDPTFARGHWAISEPLEQQQKYQEATTELEKARQIDETPIMLALLGHLYAVTGKTSDARRIVTQLNALSKQAYLDPYFLAEIHTALGDRDQAFQELEKAYEQRSSWLVWLKVEPKFDSLRDDARYTSLLKRIGL